MSLNLEERKKKVKKYSDSVIEKIELARRTVTWFTSRDFEKYNSTELSSVCGLHRGTEKQSMNGA
jgi:cobalamin biosynthesis protein CobD/CbiB